MPSRAEDYRGLSTHSQMPKEAVLIQAPACGISGICCWKKPVPGGYTLHDGLQKWRADGGREG